MTAYESNTRVNTAVSRSGVSRWNPKLDQLVAQDYSFTGLKYTDNGVLFRGMSHGLVEALNNNAFGWFEDNKPHAQLEQQLDILFVSHDLSDAISCSRIWEPVDNAGILVLSTAVFNDACDRHQAAMMRFAEPGVLFNYPLLCQEIPIQQVLFIFINRETKQGLQRAGIDLDTINKNLIVFEGQDRGTFEKAMQDFLSRRQLGKAVPVAAADWPGRKS